VESGKTWTVAPAISIVRTDIGGGGSGSWSIRWQDHE
jgi:hypothetical protein